MLHTLWNTILYRPLYNLLLLALMVMPNADVGLAVIALTILVKLVLFPLTQKSIESQMKMKALEPELTRIKAEVTDKAEQSRQTFALYKEKKISPFSSCLLILVQLPVIIALYMVFLHGFAGASVAPYSFLHIPATFNLKFLGLFDLAKKSIVLALIAGVTQYFQGYLAQKRTGKAAGGEGMAGQFAATMQTQMLYVLPVMIVLIAYRVGGAVALYWITSNMVTIGQELYTRRRMAQGKIL